MALVSSLRDLSFEISKIYSTSVTLLTWSIFIKSIIRITRRYDARLKNYHLVPHSEHFLYIRNRKPFLCKKTQYNMVWLLNKKSNKRAWSKRVRKEKERRQGDKRKERRDIRLKKENKIEFTLLREKKEACKSLCAAYLLTTFERAKFFARIFSHAVQEFR